MKKAWFYTDFNYETETWNVIYQTVGKKDKILREFKREGDALNYELKLLSPIIKENLKNKLCKK